MLVSLDRTWVECQPVAVMEGWLLHRVAVVSLPCFCPFHDSGSNQLGPIYGHTSVMTGSLLDDHHWHSVVIERQGRSINLTLDRGMQHFRTNGEFDYLDLDYEVSWRMRLLCSILSSCLSLLLRLCVPVSHIPACPICFILQGKIIFRLERLTY